MSIQEIKTCDYCGDTEKDTIIVSMSKKARKFMSEEHLCEYCARDYCAENKEVLLIEGDWCLILSTEDWDKLNYLDIDFD